MDVVSLVVVGHRPSSYGARASHRRAGKLHVLVHVSHISVLAARELNWGLSQVS